MTAARYATPLPQLTEEVATLAARACPAVALPARRGMDGHLKKMGAVWK